jgi:hypothetical protein
MIDQFIDNSSKTTLILLTNCAERALWLASQRVQREVIVISMNLRNGLIETNHARVEDL